MDAFTILEFTVSDTTKVKAMSTHASAYAADEALAGYAERCRAEMSKEYDDVHVIPMSGGGRIVEARNNRNSGKISIGYMMSKNEYHMYD